MKRSSLPKEREFQYFLKNRFLVYLSRQGDDVHLELAVAVLNKLTKESAEKNSSDLTQSGNTTLYSKHF